MKKSIAAFLLSISFILPLSAYEWGGIEKLGTSIGTGDFTSVSPKINSSTYLWGSAPIADTGLKFVGEGVFKYTGDITSAGVLSTFIFDIDLLKLDYSKNSLSLSAGRYFNSDVTAIVLNQNIDGVKVTYDLSSVAVGAYAGYTGLLNELNVFMLDTNSTIIAPLGEVYSMAYPFVIGGATLKMPVIVGNQSLGFETLCAIDLGVEKANRYYVTARIEGPLGAKIYYDLNSAFGSINFKNFMNCTTANLYLYLNNSLEFDLGVEYATSEFTGITSNVVFNNMAGKEACGNAGVKAGSTYIGDGFIITGDVIALCQMPESGFAFSGCQFDISVIYNIFYDFQLSYGTYGYVDVAESGKNNAFGMNLNIALSF